MVFLREGYGARLDATVEVVAPVSVVNAALPFADPIAPGYHTPNGKYRPLMISSYRDHDRRQRYLTALVRESQRLGLSDNDF